METENPECDVWVRNIVLNDNDGIGKTYTLRDLS